MVANFTVRMRRLAFLLLLALPASAEQWSASVATGPFVFGHFAESNLTIGNENGSSTTRSRLSAATRAGAAADVERSISRRLAVRFEAAWARAPMSIKSTTGSSSVSFDAGRLSLTTLSLPLVIHLNRGAFQFHILGGPAYALYSVKGRAAGAPVFDGTRGRMGVIGGIGVAWWWNPRFALEWNAIDTTTGSPIERSDVGTSPRVRILRPQNGHTTIGLRYRF